MSTARALLHGRDAGPWFTVPDARSIDVLRTMAELDIGALAVLRDGHLVGIVSERDYVRKIVLRGRAPETPVREIMTSKVVVARPELTVSECMALMIDKRIRHLPVLENGRYVGMLSIRDVVRTTIADQQFVIEQLEHYISR